MPQRVKLVVAYDGSAFAGWQSQLHRKTVQDELERAFHKISGERARVHGAGRTDAGVHALAQCAHVDLSARRMPISQWSNARSEERRVGKEWRYRWSPYHYK